MSHQGVRTKNSGSGEKRRKNLSQLYQRDERGGGREGRDEELGGEGGCRSPFSARLHRLLTLETRQ